MQINSNAVYGCNIFKFIVLLYYSISNPLILMTATIAPSILSADFANLASEVSTILPYSEYVHFDVMDAHFVPALTVGSCVL